MHKDLKVSTPSLGASTELVVLAPIKPGLVPALDAVTYTSRATMLLRALHGGRRNAHEYNLLRAMSDAVERVGVIQTLRVAVLGPELVGNEAGSILLSVNFDGAYEAYVRVIWQKSARLLDLIFCNTVGHVTGWDHSYDAWSGWLRRHQVETPFYYATPGLTKDDTTYLRMLERCERRGAPAEQIVELAVPGAERTAWSLITAGVDPQDWPHGQPGELAALREAVRQGLQGLAGVYRLADLYPPATPDGTLLHRAACELLPEFVRMLGLPGQYDESIDDAAGTRLHEPLAWLRKQEPLPAPRQAPALPATEPALPQQVQGGILRPFEHMTHGCACLVAFDDAAAAARFLRAFPPTAADPGQRGDGVNVALTFEGLRACGVPAAVLDELPLEFRQGMEQRAGLLGDVHANHPRRWTLPAANWAAVRRGDVDWVPADDGAGGRVELQTVHAMLHLRRSGAVDRSCLAAELDAAFAGLPGVRVLSVQWLQREFMAGQPAMARDHFGYADGHSDPVFGPDPGWYSRNQVHLGEALVGRPNAADAAPELDPRLRPLLADASFLVVRKLRQEVAAFERTVAEAAATLGLDADLIKAKLMGRFPDGRPVVGGDHPNDFDYAGDNGKRCPLAAHIRRAHPRPSPPGGPGDVDLPPGARPPRLFRRGMSYTESAPGGQVRKGLFFMAYNASIGEQFEVVQRWLAGGNSAGGYSGVADPILGIPEPGRQRWFRFEHDGRVYRLALDGNDQAGTEPEPLVRLEWGAYLLAPSLDGIAHLAALADQAAAGAPWDAERGERELQRLLDLESRLPLPAAVAAWKAALEDPERRRDYDTASLWAAVRQRHGGAVATAYGVLVADDALVRQVLADDQERYSVDGYQRRLHDTIGEIYLGLDDGADYRAQSAACNAAITELGFEGGFRAARHWARQALQQWVAEAEDRARRYGELRWRLDIDIRELNEKVLAGMLEDWFGLSEQNGHFKAGGFDWAWTDDGPALYPGSFYTPSRDTFQPWPDNTVTALAQRHGRQLRQRMNAFLGDFHGQIDAPVTRAVLDTTPAGAAGIDLAARTVAGAIMGFVPTADGALRRIVAEWLRAATLWQLRGRTGPDSLDDPAAAAELLHDEVLRTMMLRPTPEVIWRTATVDHALLAADGRRCEVKKGQVMVLGLLSATQELLAKGKLDVFPAFGGERPPKGPPTHACPGYGAAMGMITGVLATLVDAPWALRAGAASGVLAFDGPATSDSADAAVPSSTATPWLLPAPALDLVERQRLLGDLFERADKGVLLGWGDSWLELQHLLEPWQWDLGVALAEMGWDTRGFKDARHGLTLREMAAQPKRTGFYRRVRDGLASARAVLIDGGGNDVHVAREVLVGGVRKKMSPLKQLLRPADGGAFFEPGAIEAFVHTELRGQMDTVLAHLVDASEGKLPILVHGYDHPIPDGRGFDSKGGPWLQPDIAARGYSVAQGIEIMHTLIHELNLMIHKAVQPWQHKLVFHVDLCKTLAAQPGYDLQTGYQRFWTNELHPTRDGYRALAAKVDAALAHVLA